MKRQIKHLFIVYCVLTSFAFAAEADQQAMARADAYVNMSRIFYNIQISPNQTVADIVSATPGLRTTIDAAILAAPVVDGTFASNNGVSCLVIELDTNILPYELKSKIRNLPPFIRVEGLALTNALPKAAGAEAKGLSEKTGEWMGKPLACSGTALVQRSSDPDKANQDARRKALASAFAELLKKVDELVVEEGITIRDYVAQREELREHLKATLAHAALDKESFDKDTSTHKAEISFDPALLPPALRLGSYRAVPVVKVNKDQISLCRENALGLARENLKNKILAIPTGGMKTVGALVEQKPELGGALDKAIRMSQIDKMEVLDNGMVKLIISIATSELPADIQKVLPATMATRVTAIGGGLSRRSTPAAE